MPQGIFGPGADAVRQGVDSQNRQEDYSRAAGGTSAILMSNAGGAGRRLGGALEGLAGYEDPQVAKAKLLDEAKNEVDQSGADLMQDPSAYYSAAYQALSSRGLQDEAAGVRNIMLSEQAQAAKTAKDLRGTDKGFSPVDDKGYVTNKTDGTTRQVPGYPVDSPTEDKTKNVETYQLPDGILIQAQDGSEEAAKILAGGGVPYRAPQRDLRGTDKGFSMDKYGNRMQISTGKVLPRSPNWEGGTDEADSEVRTYSPPGSTNKGGGNEKTVARGGPSEQDLLGLGWVLTDDLPNPPGKGTNITVNNSSGDKNAGLLARKELEDIRAAGRAADGQQKQVSMLRQQLQSTAFDPGLLANFREFMGTAAQYLGVSDEVLSAMRQQPNDANVLKSLTANMVGAQAAFMQSAGGSNSQLSAAELKLYKDAGASLGQTAGGMYILNEMWGLQADYQQRERDAATKIYATRPPEENDAMALVEIDNWRKDNPFRIPPPLVAKIKLHSRIVERGKNAKDIGRMNKADAKQGGLYRVNGVLMVYQGLNKSGNAMFNYALE